MRAQFIDSKNIKYTFSVTDKIPSIEVGYPGPTKEIILQVFIEYEGYAAGLVNVSLKDDLIGVCFLPEEVQQFIKKTWKNKAFL